MHRDFTDLIAIFDRQVSSLPAYDSRARAHVARARAAAERGLRLSQDLIEGMNR
jgi:hypothetical protein